MACDITKGLLDLDCKNAVAGLRAIYVANYAEHDWEISGSEAEEISTLPVTLTEVFRYVLKNTGNTFVEDIESSRDNGTTVFNQTLNFVINKIGAKKHFQVKNLAWGRPIIFVETNMGDVFVMGRENGNEVSGGANIEGELTGANNYALVAEAVERDPIAFLTSTAIEDLKGIVSEESL